MINLKPLAVVVIAMVAIQAAWVPLVLATAHIAPGFFSFYVTPVARIVDACQILFTILTMVVFAAWIVVAGKNLMRAGYRDLDFTPASRVWWFAVPFANFVKPYQGMRELWNASRGASYLERNNGLLGTWWALWLANAAFSYVAIAADKSDQSDALLVLVVSSALGIARAAAAILLVWGISSAQSRLGGPALAEVFA